MTRFVIELLVVLIGLAVTPVLFFRFPRLPGRSELPGRPADGHFPKVSVIIPARNEERSLPLLLADLRDQSAPPLEIICADDASTDATARTAESFGARVISLRDKPEGWIGKSWACKNGADAASGDLLLFVDADVRLGRDAILRLTEAYSGCGCTISVQPRHRTEKVYEQFSLMFNLVQIAANGTALPKPAGAGLYGPVILFPRSDYNRIGGHESVRKSIVEDMALGQRLRKSGLSYRLFVGDEDIAFRMYGDGLKSLLQGWTKNMAAGAIKTAVPVFAMVFFWITSLTSVPVQIIQYAVAGNTLRMSVYLLLYAVWVSILGLLAGRVGRFRLAAVVCYPVLMAGFLGVFAVSLFKKVFRMKVTWKGRAVESEDKRCE